MTLVKATLKLFKSVEIKDTVKNTDESIDKIKIISKTIKEGFIFDSKVLASYTKEELKCLIDIVKDEFTLNPTQMNSSFHKSWNKIATSSYEQLVIEQIIHYITTYGFESLGVYEKDSVYIPKEELHIPDINIDDINIMIIKGMTKKELKEKLMLLLSSGIALSQDTINDVVEIAKFVNINRIDIEKIKNKEVNVILYQNLNIIPENPVEFLRYIVYRHTGKTLLIKDNDTIKEIKQCYSGLSNKKIEINILLIRYTIEYKNGFEKLASIFYRFKPIFLALRRDSESKKIINHIRRLARKYHEPMKKDYLNSLIEIIRSGEYDDNLLEDKLSGVNTFRKIRLASTMKYQFSEPSSIVYLIRNGKSYSTECKKYYHLEEYVKENMISAYKIIMESIISDIKNNVNGKKIYIPKNVSYALPTSEKKFTGNVPNGTSIDIVKDMIVGVHWENVNYKRIDLDLSLLDETGGKTGWNGRYRTEEGDVLFSGDMTDAPLPNGASELFYIKNNTRTYLVMLNNYNAGNINVPFKLFIASQKVSEMTKKYIVDPNNVISTTKMDISKEQKMLGFIENGSFYFTNNIIGGRSRISGIKNYTQHTINYYIKSAMLSLNMNRILQYAGAILVDNKENCDIDLSLENLEKTTIIDLIK